MIKSCRVKHINQATNPNPTDNSNDKEDFREIATIINKTAVAGNPHKTPIANLLKLIVCSPCTYNQNKLSKLTKGSAAIIPPYFGKILQFQLPLRLLKRKQKFSLLKTLFGLLTKKLKSFLYCFYIRVTEVF